MIQDSQHLCMNLLEEGYLHKGQRSNTYKLTSNIYNIRVEELFIYRLDFPI